MTREKGRAAVPDGAEVSEVSQLAELAGGAKSQEVPAPRRRLTADTLGLFRDEWRGLYGFSFGVALFAALVGAALVAAAFALSWHDFALTWKYARADIAYEDPPVGYFPEQRTSIFLRSAPFMGLLLPLAVFVLALLHTACAVAVRDAQAGGRPRGAGRLWRHCRPYTWLAFRAHLLTSVCTGPLALLALVVWMFFENGGVMDIDIDRLSQSTSTPYRLLGYGLPLVILTLAFAVWLRLGLAIAAAVNGAPTARTAVRRSWTVTGGRRRWRAFSVGVLLTALVVAAYNALAHAAEPLAHPVGLAVLWLTNDNPYATGAVLEIVPAAASLLLLTALIVPPVSAALAFLRTELCRDLSGAMSTPSER